MIDTLPRVSFTDTYTVLMSENLETPKGGCTRLTFVMSEVPPLCEEGKKGHNRCQETNGFFLTSFFF